jgi:hypothetical protein
VTNRIFHTEKKKSLEYIVKMENREGVTPVTNFRGHVEVEKFCGDTGEDGKKLFTTRGGTNNFLIRNNI